MDLKFPNLTKKNPRGHGVFQPSMGKKSFEIWTTGLLALALQFPKKFLRNSHSGRAVRTRNNAPPRKNILHSHEDLPAFQKKLGALQDERESELSSNWQKLQQAPLHISQRASHWRSSLFLLQNLFSTSPSKNKKKK